MAKIGRNEKCPCGSGKKYKHCCSRNPTVQQRPATPEEQLKISLMGAVDSICRAAEDGKQLIRELGVFVLCATTGGDAWLFEVTQADCVQLAAERLRLPVPIDENPQTIEVEWSHTFAVVDRELRLRSYADRTLTVCAGVPVKELSAAFKRIRKKVPAEMLDKIHISPESDAPA